MNEIDSLLDELLHMKKSKDQQIKKILNYYSVYVKLEDKMEKVKPKKQIIENTSLPI